jgi:hypothetical protein
MRLANGMSQSFPKSGAASAIARYAAGDTSYTTPSSVLAAATTAASSLNSNPASNKRCV